MVKGDQLFEIHPEAHLALKKQVMYVGSGESFTSIYLIKATQRSHTICTGLHSHV